MKEKIKKVKLICPKCKADLKKDGVTYVEDGCVNYINYIVENGNWVIESETLGDNPQDCYYICRQCQNQLPHNLQEYFGNNI